MKFFITLLYWILFYVLFSEGFIAKADPTVTFSLPTNGNIYNVTHYDNQRQILAPNIGSLIEIANISSNATSGNFLWEELYIDVDYDAAGGGWLSQGVDLWVWSDASPDPTGGAATWPAVTSIHGAISPQVGTNYHIYAGFHSNAIFSNCKTITISMFTLYKDQTGHQTGSGTTTFSFARYDPGSLNTSDLFVKDNYMDDGTEPLPSGFINSSDRTADLPPQNRIV